MYKFFLFLLILYYINNSFLYILCIENIEIDGGFNNINFEYNNINNNINNNNVLNGILPLNDSFFELLSDDILRNNENGLNELSIEFWINFKSSKVTNIDQMKSENNIISFFPLYENNIYQEKMNNELEYNANNENEDKKYHFPSYSIALTLSMPERTINAHLRVKKNDENGWDDKLIKGRTSLISNLWHHVVLVYNSNNNCYNCGRIQLFIDGKLENIDSYIELPNKISYNWLKKLLIINDQNNLSNLWFKNDNNNNVNNITPITLWPKALNIIQIRKLMENNYNNNNLNNEISKIYPIKLNLLNNNNNNINNNNLLNDINLSILIWKEDQENNLKYNSDNILCNMLHLLSYSENWENYNNIEILIATTTNKETIINNNNNNNFNCPNEKYFSSKFPIPKIYYISDNNNNYSNIMNKLSKNIKYDNSYILFLSTLILPTNNFINELILPLINNNNDNIILTGSKILYSNTKIFHYGYKYERLTINGETNIIPLHSYRGLRSLDKRVNNDIYVKGVSKLSMMISYNNFNKLNGFNIEMSPWFEDTDLSLRIIYNLNGKIKIINNSILFHDDPQYTKELDAIFESDRLNQRLFNINIENSLKKFQLIWKDILYNNIKSNWLNKELKFSWIIHCGGSQGFEAFNIIQGLNKKLNIRAIIRRYRECEHTDTLSGMPAYFRDIVDSVALRRFVEPYIPANIRLNNNNITINDDGSGAISLYARDYREIGRWIPTDSEYVIGRYMFEADRLPKAWVKNIERIDETWVPSKWQKGTFISSGINEDKIYILPEAIDHYFFDPDTTLPLSLPGTSLDYPYWNSIDNKPYVFLSVFKMEDRKGWAELIYTYLHEFKDDQNVILLLRTYLHRAGDSGDIEDKTEMFRRIEAMMSKMIDWLPNGKLPKYPRIEIIDHHLPGEDLPGLYKSADAFVLPTHAEGWGLPTMEAMTMGLPTITTNWGGSTEFISKEVALPIKVESIQQTSPSDPWLRGFNWAQPDVQDLARHMRWVYNNRNQAKQLGKKARQHIINNFTIDKVSNLYAKRLIEIQNKINEKIKNELNNNNNERKYINDDIILEKKNNNDNNNKLIKRTPHALNVMSSFHRKWRMGSEYKKCAVTSPPFDLNNLKESLKNTNMCKIAIISTYPPRECGIATFTENLRNGLINICKKKNISDDNIHIDIVAVKHENRDISEFDQDIVKYTIDEYNMTQYIEAAQWINNNNYDFVILEYEFGIFWSGYILCFAREIKTRLLTTLHTVSKSYWEEYHAIVENLVLISHKSIVMTEDMRIILDIFHSIPPNKIVVIPHGVPDYPLIRTQDTSKQILFPGRKIMMSNGLIHGYKGLEYAIWAMPEILKKYPRAMYIIQGKPHPNGVDTKEYYQYLKDLVNDLNLKKSVIFRPQFVPTEQLVELLQSVHIYINPYVDESQASSGTLAMALSAGAAVISTPYPYAKEVLKNNVGVFVPFRDSYSISKEVIKLFDSPELINEYNQRAYNFSRYMTWENVAQEHISVATLLTKENE